MIKYRLVFLSVFLSQEKCNLYFSLFIFHLFFNFSLFIYLIAATTANTVSVASTVDAGIHSVLEGHSLTSGTNLFGRYF